MHILCISWAYLGHILDISWTYLGHILYISWAYLLHISCTSWAYLGHILDISWAYLGHILGISFAYLGHILGISWAYLDLTRKISSFYRYVSVQKTGPMADKASPLDERLSMRDIFIVRSCFLSEKFDLAFFKCENFLFFCILLPPILNQSHQNVAKTAEALFASNSCQLC